MRGHILTLAAVLSVFCAPVAFAQDNSGQPSDDPTARVFELMLPADHLLGDWGGVRPKLEYLGVTPRLIVVTDLAGNPSGGLSQGTTAPTSIELSLIGDLDKMF